MIKLLIGGSPCTFWSVAQRKHRETEPDGMGWELFKNYLLAREKFSPDLFLYENNVSAASAVKQEIRERLAVGGGKYIEINSALVSAQNRKRFYVHNCGEVEQPRDRGILLSDILESGLSCRDKSLCLVSTYYKKNENDYFPRRRGTVTFEPVGVGYRNRREADGKLYRRFETHCEPKANAITTVQTDSMVAIESGAKHEKPCYEVKDGKIEIKGRTYAIRLPDGFYTIRKLTPIECERLQTMPDNYTAAVSASQRYKALGNGWTAEVIKHILGAGLRSVDRNEKLLVLSMYDGIGTGRYVLDSLGFRNVEYHSYEIDKFAIKVANSNYDDIIQHGDAFDLRRSDWRIEP